VNATNAARDALLARPMCGWTNARVGRQRQNCGQECLSQVNADPATVPGLEHGDQWYKGKSCGVLPEALHEIHWA